jgi:uncharacterized protein YbjT (DUF2867 family)
MTAKAKVLVMGATGQVGGALIPLLKQQVSVCWKSFPPGYVRSC